MIQVAGPPGRAQPMSAKTVTKVTKTKTALKQETYNLSSQPQAET
jgi:hypothetical protein